jgi:dTDP-4-dehydrorhamnose reductase
MIAVVGCNGQLGWELSRLAQVKGRQALALDLPDIDITDAGSVSDCLSPHHLAAVVNAAAYTAVDKAESEPDLAYAVNKDGPARLADYCAARNIPLIHISTDYVFDGKKTTPYLETDPVAPLGIYGRSKEAGEVEIRRRHPAHVIIRTAWLYGLHGNNFVKTMLRLGAEKDAIRVVNDQTGCPTNARDLAGAVFAVIEKIEEGGEVRWGTYHYCGEGATTWFEFATAAFDIARRYRSFKLKTITPVSTAEYPTPAARPRNSVLDSRRIKEVFHVQTRPWKHCLKEVIEGILMTASI